MAWWLGMVTQWQQLFYEDRFVSQYLNLPFLSSGLPCFRTPFFKKATLTIDLI